VWAARLRGADGALLREWATAEPNPLGVAVDVRGGREALLRDGAWADDLTFRIARDLLERRP
jgi:hypothetical protein